MQKSKARNILVLGSGLMTDTIVTLLLKNPKNFIHIGSNHLESARQMAQRKGLQRCTYSEVHVENSKTLKPLIYPCDLVVSYIPAFLHHHVAKVCLQLGKNLITASYISKEMMEFDKQAKEKGLIFLNELGLDPGIDHLATMQIVDEVYSKGGKIVEYESWCGGLPAPSCCDNPLGYKFTWSPIGAFRALKNRAVYINQNKEVQLLPEDLLYAANTIDINNALSLQGYPNRDSVSYKHIYGLKDANKVLRGTLRYKGFCQIISAFKEVGYFDETKIKGRNWLDYTTLLLQNEQGSSLNEKLANRAVYNNKHYSTLSKEEKNKLASKIVTTFRYFCLTQPINFVHPEGTNLQNLVELLKPKLALKLGETDLIAMQHRFIIELNGKKYLRKSSMIEIGEKNGMSAMGLTVSAPTSIGAELILEGKIKERGVLRPIYKDIYEPCLERLAKLGVRLVEEEEEI